MLLCAEGTCRNAPGEGSGCSGQAEGGRTFCGAIFLLRGFIQKGEVEF